MSSYLENGLLLLLLMISLPRITLGMKCKDGDLTEDPTYCNKFFKCSTGIPRSLSCPSGLLYNKQAKICDWPEAVSCGKKIVDFSVEENEHVQKIPKILVDSSENNYKEAHFKNPVLTGLSITPGLEARAPLNDHRISKPRFFSLPSGASVIRRFPSSLTVSIHRDPSPSRKVVQDRTDATVASVFHSTLANLPRASSGKKIGSDPDIVVQSRCNLKSREPISGEVRRVRNEVCTLDMDTVALVRPGRKLNPQNVRTVESVVTEMDFNGIFPKADPSYTYLGFLQGVAQFPYFCSSSLDDCGVSLAMLLAHIYQETEGLKHNSEHLCGEHCDYCDISNSWVKDRFPCSPGKQYYGRGAKQLSWNYNYGQFSLAIFGTEKTLLDNPDLVATSWLNFASAVWYFLTPQPPKPSIQNIALSIKYGFGDSIRVINGGLECGDNRGSQGQLQAANRARYYTALGKAFGVQLEQQGLDCGDNREFQEMASLHWAPELQCSLVAWQTAHSALLEGEWNKCMLERISSS